MIAERDPCGPVWRKSSYSGGGGATGTDDCLEVADNIPGVVPVRDSKTPGGPILLFPTPAWTAFVATLGEGLRARRG
ncbi:hypothetical protein AF335_09810 [Streptomyces eurocidicus]|uniref:DUF397 domain-containing protein n=1 Tax=Streptomyces eurocidicus TaxID=66423 RepID=A0A2N8NWR9_STREU|nr:DUF397 domain-containing protein [Streptomyces eurocidicus]MBB5117979.1 hypothetical protein [Streptomyces eurocidicus]MBF6053958.1 DUF397 domain-containing protein [Streptomyces eurocidicus]PNE33220.1 hypothetical protein AF335_09810 [Streptomyces eurocidicus]